MPQVPYSPVPDVTPTQQGPGPMRIETPGAAFGTNVAAAVESVGGDLNKAGNEIFARAMAIQDLQNRADADKAFQGFVEQQGKIHADFNTLQGEDRAKAYPKYIEDTHSLRNQMGANLNPMARKLYDTESRSQTGRMIFSGAVLAADAQKDFLIKNGEASLQLLAKTVSDNPGDEALYNDSVAKAKQGANYLAGLHGFGVDSEYENLKSKDAVSTITRNRLIALNQDNPAKAMEAFERLKGNLLEKDKDYIFSAIQGQNRSIGVANIANDTFTTMYDDTGKQIKSLNQAEGEVRIKAQQLAPNDPVFANRSVNQLRALNTQRFQADKMDDWQAGQQIRDFIAAHPEIKTEQQLRAVPEMAQTLDGMNFKGRGIDTPGYIHRYLDSKFKEVNDETYYQLRGLAISNREQFLDMDFTKEQLNQRQIDALNHYRKSLIEKPGDDPHLKNAMLWMQQTHGQELEALNIARYDKNNPDDYIKYQGAMLQAIEAWKDSNQGRVPGFKDIQNEIGPAVLKKYAQPKWFGMRSEEVPEYRMDIPQDFIDERRKTFPNRTDDMLRRDWNAFMFQQMFGPTVQRGDKGDKALAGTDNAVTNAPPVKPSVPMSQ